MHPPPARPARLYARHYLLWDGGCALCARFAAWVQRNDRRARFHVTPYQDCPSPPMDSALREASAGALHVVRADGHVLHSGRAVLFILDRLGWARAARLLSAGPLLPLVEAGYRWVAGHRSLVCRLFRIGPGYSNALHSAVDAPWPANHNGGESSGRRP